jgi:release factor glutamine methyltransferase
MITAVDISADAIAVASRNARRHRVEDRVTLRHGDCFDVRDTGPALGLFDVVVSNPPYLDDAEIAALEPEVSRFEPRIALNGGASGLDVVQRVTTGAREHLETNGELIIEMAACHMAEVVGEIALAGLKVVDLIKDLSGQFRVARGRNVDKSEWKK